MSARVLLPLVLVGGCYGSQTPAEPGAFRPHCGPDRIERCVVTSTRGRSAEVTEIEIAGADVTGAARIASGADMDCRPGDELDGACGHRDYVDLHGNPGIDNQYGPAHLSLFPDHPRWRFERALRIVGNSTTAECAGVALGALESSGGRWSSDETRVEALLPDLELGVPITILHDGVAVREEVVSLRLRDVAIRVPLPDSTEELTALVVGTFAVEELVPAYVGSDPTYLRPELVDDIVSVQADLSPDPSGACTEVSAAFLLHGRWST
jgi:hypothetical protein